MLTATQLENRRKYLEFIRDPENQEKYRIAYSIWSTDRDWSEPKFCVLGAALKACTLSEVYQPGVSNAYALAEEALGLQGDTSWMINRKNDHGTPWPEIADWLEESAWHAEYSEDI